MVNKTRHLNLTIRSFWSRRNIIVVALLAAWLLSAAGVSLWFALQNGQYRKDFATHTADIRQTLATASQEFKNLHEASDTTGTAKALVALASNLNSKVAHMPAPPMLFGVRFGTDAEVARQSAITQGVTAYATSLNDASAYVDYQQKIAAPLGELALKNATNAEQINQLAVAWQDVATRHKQVTPPSKIAATHDALGKKLEEIQAHIAQLGPLYAKIDIAGFTAKQKELVGAIEALKPVGEEFARFAKDYDSSLSTNLTALNASLR